MIITWGVRVRTSRPDNALLIAIYSSVLPNDIRVKRSLFLEPATSILLIDNTCFIFTLYCITNDLSIYNNLLLKVGDITVFILKITNY